MHEGIMGEFQIGSSVKMPDLEPAVKIAFRSCEGGYVCYVSVADAERLAMDLLNSIAAAHADVWVARFARDKVGMDDAGVEAAITSFREYREAYDDQSRASGAAPCARSSERSDDDDRDEGERGDGPDPFVSADAQGATEAASE